MKKTIKGKKLEALLESIHQKDPKGLLVIESKFQVYLVNTELCHLLKDVVSGKVSSKKVVLDSIAAMKRLIRLAKSDISNIRRCVSFIRKKLPHAIFSCGDFSIGIHNLTREEIKLCRQQRGLNFTYSKD